MHNRKLKIVKQFLQAVSVLLISTSSQAQSRPGEFYPPRNKPVPAFRLTGIKGFRTNTISDKSMKGKWYVLDFWNSHCGSCIASFPGTDSMAKQFKGKIDFFLVGVIGDNDPAYESRRLDSIYKARKQKLNLNIPNVHGFALGKKWGIYTAPDILVIDDKGVVRAHTFQIRPAKLDSLINGYSPVFEKFPDEIEYP